MVHTNNFCEMGLESCGPKGELWTKTEFLEGWKIPKFKFHFNLFDFEFPCDIEGSGCRGSIRLVKSVWKKYTSTFSNDIFDKNDVFDTNEKNDIFNKNDKNDIFEKK